MTKFIRGMLTKKTAIVVSTMSIIAIVLIATSAQVLASTPNSSPPKGFWAQESKWAIAKARVVTSRALSVIMEQAEQGKNVTIAKKLLATSIRICEVAEGAYNEDRYRKAFCTAILSVLVARDSARVAVDGPETVDVILDEVGEEIDEIEAFLDELEESGVDITLPRKVLEWAETVYTEAQGMLEDGKPVRAVVTAEKSRMIARIAVEIALITSRMPEISETIQLL